MVISHHQKGADHVVPTARASQIPQFEAPIPGDESEIPAFVCPSPERLQILERLFVDVADTDKPLDPQTQDYLRSGGSARLLISEIDKLSAPRSIEVEATQSREAYLDILLTGTLRPWQNRELSKLEIPARDTYVASVMARIAEVLDAQKPEEALAVRQMPSLVRKASFEDTGTPLELDDLAANHLYILVDTVLREHIQRRHYIDQRHRQTRVARISSNRLLRAAIGAGVFGLALSPHVGLVTGDNEQVAANVELTLKCLSGFCFSIESTELVRYTYNGLKQRRQSKKLQNQLAQSQELSDLSLRATYNSTRYGDKSGLGVVTDRAGTPDPEVNKKRFAKLDSEFVHLNNDPGGKPYTGDQALGYSGRLFIERRGQLEQILDPGRTAEERRGLFLALCQDVMMEDLSRMRRGIRDNRVRQFVVDHSMIPLALVMNSSSSALSEATTLVKDAGGAIKGSSGEGTETR